MDLYDAASYHALALRAAGRSPKTLTAYLASERRFLEFLRSRKLDADLAALNTVNVRQTVIWLQRSTRGKRGGTVAQKMFVVHMKAWASFLTREQVLGGDPLRGLQAPRTLDIERQPYTRTDVLAMLEAAKRSRTPIRDRLLVHLLLDTGARITEITTLELERIQLEPPHRRLTVIGKGNRERSIPFGDATVSDGGETARLLRTYMREREAFFERYPHRRTSRLLLTIQGFALSTNGAEEVIRRLGWQAGVQDAVPHRFRHTFATVYLTEYAGDETGLRAILGHVSADVMRHYLHMAAATIGQRAGKVSPSQNWLRVGR